MRRIAAGILLLLIASPLISGCWSRKEIDELSIILGAAVDKAGPNQVRLTVATARPTEVAAREGRGRGKPMWVVSAEGRTIEEADRRLALESPRHLFWAHTKLLVIGEEMARSGVDPILDFFARGRETRLTIWVVVSRGEGREILKAVPELQKLSPIALKDILKSRAGFTVNLRDFLEMRTGEDIQPVAGLVEAVPNPASQEGPGQREVKLAGLAIFKKGTMVGTMDETPMRGYYWFRREEQRGIITAPSPKDPTAAVSVEIRRRSTRIEPMLEGAKPAFKVKVRAEGDLAEQQSPVDLTKPETIKTLEESINREIAKRIQMALDVAQKQHGADIFGFGKQFNIRAPGLWKEIKKDWDERFREAEISIEVDFKLRQTGMSSKPLGFPKEELKK